MFPGQTVTPVPFIANGDSAQDVGAQEQVLQAEAFRERARLQSLPLDLKWMTMKGFDEARNENMAGSFLTFMAHNFLPLISPALQMKASLTIAVVTHWETMQKAIAALCSRQTEMKHTEVVDLTFIYKGYAVVADARGKIVKAEQVDPYISSAKEAWEEIQKLPDENALASLLPSLGRPVLIDPGAPAA